MRTDTQNKHPPETPQTATMSNPLFSYDSMRRSCDDGRNNNLSIGSLAEIKFIITSVVVPQSTSKFAALIKNANDSDTFRTSFENKTIFARNDFEHIRKSDESLTDAADIIDSTSISTETVPMDISNDSFSQLKGSATSSTPVKFVERKSMEEYKLDLHSPPDDASFIDSDLEDECNVVLRRHIASESDDETLKNNPDATPTKFFFKKPLQSTLRRHKKMLKKPKLLKFFTNRRRRKSSKLQRSDKCSAVDDSDESSRSTSSMSKYSELGCTPLLLTDNINRLYESKYKQTEWGEDFDFSFICEPSTSDVEDDQYERSDSPCEFQPIAVPTFRIIGPDARPEDCSPTCKEASVHSLRRSVSIPNFVSDLLNRSAEMSYDNFVEAVARLEGTTSHCASVRNLDTLSVSFVDFVLFVQFISIEI